MNSTIITRAAKLLPYVKRAKTLPSFATAYYYEPEPGPGAELGSLFVVIEILTAAKQAEEVADLIIKTAGEYYYNLPATDENEEQAGKLEPYTQFEHAIKAVNVQLADYTNQGNASWVGRLSAVIAVQAGEQLHITQTGSASGYLYRHKNASHITEDINGRGPHQPASTFNNIASGQLEPEDRLLMATPALFHQIGRDQLQRLVTESTPQVAVGKLSELIGATPNVDRVAALCIEVTTPELLAMERDPEPEDAPASVQVGEPESKLAGVKAAAAPALSKGLGHAGRLGRQAAHRTRHQLWPWLRQHGGNAGSAIWRLITNRQQRPKVYIAGGLILIALAWLVYSSANAGAIDRLAKRYDGDYTDMQQAKQALASGDKTTARSKLQTADKDLASLSGLPQSKLLDRRLQHRNHPEDDPASVNGLKAQVGNLLDQVDGIVNVSPTDVADFDSIKGAKPSLMETVAGKWLLVDQSNGSIYVYDSSANQLTVGAQNPNGVGKVTAIAASSSGDGLYLLTDQPAVWFFKLDGNTLTKQTLSFGDWPKGKALASYNGNLYLLASDNSQIYKFIRTVGGFGSSNNYLSGDAAGNLSGASILTVDGNVYTAGAGTLKRFLNGKLSTSLNLPDSLSHPVVVSSSNDGDLLIVTDSQSGRIGTIDASGATLNLTHQLKVNGNPHLYAAIAESKTHTAVALTDGKLISFPLPR